MLKNIVFIIIFFTTTIFSSSSVYASSSILTPEQNTWLSENLGTITFAPEKDFPPMIWSQYGEMFGVSKDYFDFIQQLIDVHFKERDPRGLEEILQAVKGGEKSIISSRTMTPERSEYLLFTRPYFSSPTIFIANTGRSLTGAQIEQEGYTVSVRNHSGVHEYLKNRYSRMKLIPIDNDYKVIESVTDRHADIGALDVASLMYLIRENNFSDIKKVSDVGLTYDFAFAVPKSMPELRNILDNAIEKIPQNFQTSVLKKWGVDSTGIQGILVAEISGKNESSDRGYFTILILVVAIVIIGVDFYIHRKILAERE